jgi:hypothetical protein
VEVTPPVLLERTVRAILEDGTPVPGVSFLPMEREDGGGWTVDFEPDGPPGSTDGEGRAVLRWKAPAGGILLAALCRSAEVVAVEGGALVGPAEHGEVLSVDPSAGSLTLRMRVRAGVGVVRILDAETGEPLGVRPVEGRHHPRMERHHLVLRAPEGGEQVLRFTIMEDGGIPVMQPLLPRTVPAREDRRVLEISLPGFRTGRVRLADLRGHRDLLLERFPVSAVARFLGPSGETVRPFLRLVPGDDVGEGARRFAEEIAFGAGGRVEIRGLPPGTWTVVARIDFPGVGIRHARVTFTAGPVPVELGDVEVVRRSSARVRVVEGKGPVPDARLFLTVAEEETGPEREVLPVLWRTASTIGTGELVEQEAEIREPPVAADGEGWFVFDGLMPGLRYRVREVLRVGAVRPGKRAIAAHGDSRDGAIFIFSDPVEFEAPAEDGGRIDVVIRRREK